MQARQGGIDDNNARNHCIMTWQEGVGRGRVNGDGGRVNHARCVNTTLNLFTIMSVGDDQHQKVRIVMHNSRRRLELDGKRESIHCLVSVFGGRPL